MLSFHVEKSLAQQGSRTSSPSSSTTCLHRHAQPLSRRANSRRRLHTLRAQKQERSEAVLDLDAPSTSTPHHMAKAQEVYRTADAGIPQATSSTSNSLAELAASNPAGLATAAAALGLTTFGLVKLFNKGSRSYSNNVGQEYDAWTEEGILEYYWGEHIHLGVYSEAERAAGYTKKDFKQAKYDFIDEMLRFSGAPPNPQSILDVGCGFGGTSRHLAKKFPGAQVKGITLSPKQVERGTELAKEQGVPNASFQVMDALAMSIPDNSYDVVWACESGEHMPDKKKYVEEMVRVLKPGGTLVIACWCQREETPDKPFTDREREELQFLYDEWAHPYFISIQEFERLMKGTGKMEGIVGEDWTPQTLPSWLHSIWVGVVDPWIVISKGPRIWYKTIREIVTLVRMHKAFESGLMEYGLIRGAKLPDGSMTWSQQEAQKEPVAASQ
uniref:Methyltransferase domain-containing protein n=1 Tax=Dunaliella tertiolecta TaxID=3047 RepID=A0A7S3VSG5_DUNTE|mmetsp:Transcript_3241/g.7438  ORF Transcript_3241/g.7438 Transcript_3241/m.7438 type:complete len:442 (+) Transcript_3241:13-1338(+)